MVDQIIELLRTKNISEANLEIIRDIIICEMISPKTIKRAKKKDKIQYPSWDLGSVQYKMIMEMINKIENEKDKYNLILNLDKIKEIW